MGSPTINANVNLSPVGVVLGGGIGITSIPTVHLAVDALPTIHLAVDALPAIHLSIDHIPKIQLGLDPIEIRLTEIPKVRMHVPVNFGVGLSVLGMELMNVGLCGEAQVITEPYRPNPCEVCGAVDRYHLLLDEPGFVEAFSPGLEAAS